MKKYRFIFWYLWQHRGVASVIMLLTVVGTFFYGFGIGLFVPLLESLQQAEGASPSWVLQKIYSIYDYFGISPTFVILLFSMLCMITLKIVLTVAHNSLAHRLCVNLNKWLRQQCVDNLLQVEISFYHKKRIGDLINIIVRESTEGAQAVYMFLLILVQAFTLIMYALVMGILSWKLMTGSLFIFIVISLIIKPRVQRSNRLSHLGLINRNLLASRLFEVFSGIKVVKAYVSEKKEKKSFDSVVEEARLYQFKKRVNDLLLLATSEFTLMICLVLILFAGVRILHLELSILITFLFILSRLAPDVTKLNTYRNNLSAFIVPLEKCLALLSKDDKPYIPDGQKRFDGFSGSIVFRDISFSYGPREEAVLKNVSFEINKNEIVALVGASGSGKSTLIDLLLRFYDPGKGGIYVDGSDLRGFSLSSWRRRIGLVLQDPFLFHDTVRNNILYGASSADEGSVQEAALKACIHDDIMGFPEKYELVVGDRGIRLSGGQRQRITLARALIRNPEILVLDEAMSSLDSESESFIQEAIEKIKGSCTIVIVAHRLSTIEKADKIVVLDKGKIVETGTHRELLERKEHYARYYSLQYGVQAPLKKEEN